MTYTPPNKTTLDWLLDADPAIRWQVLQDIADAPAEIVAAERARVAHEGWGAHLLSLQQPNGDWGGGAWVYQSWASTFETLMLLREMGLDPRSEPTRKAIELVREHSNWGQYHNHAPFFEGESEPCINGRVLAIGAYFGAASPALAERLLSEQLPDGGWNCDAPESKHSSFNTTICVLEGLFAYERATGDSRIAAARQRGEEFLLQRQLYKSLQSGQPIQQDRKSGKDWRIITFPTRWHYDILWALDYLHSTGAAPDPRAAEAVALVASKQTAEGVWLLESYHDGAEHFRMETLGQPSRWLTLRALRVLRWHSLAS
ncbi:MAG: hypothetical protein KIT08_09615 [Anaerolineales bacterium]|nr:MAG: hypothetical protein KIT08_09615 [Anaerolineales bacterium]